MKEKPTAVFRVALRVGQKLGRVMILSVYSGSTSRDIVYSAICDCGKKCRIKHASINKVTIPKLSCGCYRSEVHRHIHCGSKLDLKGKVFGNLTVLKEGPRVACKGKSSKVYTTWVCSCTCGKEVALDTGKLNAGRYVSCGCLTPRATKAVRKYKKKNNRYKDPTRRSPEYFEWRSKVFNRDGYKCVKCGGKKDGINAHHVEDYESNPKLRFDISNGATLCVHCHKAFHNTYGWVGRTTRKQLEEFLRADLV